MRRTIAVAGITAAALAGGAVAGITLFTPAVGIAQEATTDPTTAETTPSDETTAPARPSWVDDVLDGLVADGTLTQDQADKVGAAFDAAAPERGPRGGPGGMHKGGPRVDVLGVAAGALGMEEADLHDALHDGQTIAEVAAGKGVDVQTVIDAIANELNASLDQAVADGRITQEEADERKADTAEHAAAIVNGERPEGPMGPGGPGGRHGRFGMTDDTGDDTADGTS